MPYPVLPTDYWANVGFWWDLEFWNRPVRPRERRGPIEFSRDANGTFPKS